MGLPEAERDSEVLSEGSINAVDVDEKRDVKAAEV